MKVSVSGHVISIDGRTKGRTHYNDQIAGAVFDTFGQTMGDDAEAGIDVGPAEPSLFASRTRWSSSIRRRPPRCRSTASTSRSYGVRL